MQQQFTVVRGEVVHPKGEAAHHAWSSGLCDCTGDWCSCLSVWCCSSVTTAQLFTRCVTCLVVEHRSHHPRPAGIAPQVLRNQAGRHPPRAAVRGGLHLPGCILHFLQHWHHLRVADCVLPCRERPPRRQCLLLCGRRGGRAPSVPVPARCAPAVARPPPVRARRGEPSHQPYRRPGVSVHLPHHLPGPHPLCPCPSPSPVSP